MEPSPGAEETIAGIEVALHDLCQPLTVLQCKLEISLLKGGEAATQAAVIDGLRECRRLNEVVRSMRALMQQRVVPEVPGAESKGE